MVVVTRLATPEIRYVLEDSGARVLLVDGAMQAQAAALAGQLPSVEALFYLDDDAPPAGMGEVEHTISLMPGVDEVAVIGIPEEKWGEAVHAIVVPLKGATLTADAVIKHCRTQIAGYKCPRSVDFRDTPLPKSGPGKVLKRELREAFSRDSDRERAENANDSGVSLARHARSCQEAS